MVDRRQHQTPFAAHGQAVVDSEGKHVALCATPELAHWFATVSNYWDRVVAAVDLCRGQFEIITHPTLNPAYREFIKLFDEMHKALRGDRG